MDGHFVPNLTIGPLVCDALRKHGVTAPIDVHLMVKPVDRVIPDFAKAGATYVSPFVGRLDDISAPGMDLVSDIMNIYGNYGYETEVIVASIRNPVHVAEAALIGADISTIPLKVIEQLAKHPLTDIGMEKFLADWEKRAK